MLKPDPIPPIPAETARVIRTILPKGNAITRLRDEFGTIYSDVDFANLYAKLGQPAIAPWRLALVTVFQFLENLTDRQAAQAVLTRLDWKYALSLEVTDTSFDFTVLSEFRSRLIQGNAEYVLLEKMLERFREQGLLKLRGQQRTDATHVLCSVRVLNRLELVGETFRVLLNELTRVAPEWLKPRMQPRWFEWFVHRVEEYRLARGQAARDAHAVAIGQDGFELLDALKQDKTMHLWLELPVVKALERIWSEQYERVDGQVHWRSSKSLASDRAQSPFDLEACYGMKRKMAWVGYKVHLTESCDDDKPCLITNVLLTKASMQDALAAKVIHERLKHNQMVPSQHFVDAGYTSVGLMLEGRKSGIEVVGSLKYDSSWQERARKGFALTNFKIDWEKKVVTCPRQKHSQHWIESLSEQGLPIIHAEFNRQDCQRCRSKPDCTKAKTLGREVTFRPQESHELLRAGRAHQETDEWRELYAKRAGIEGTISQSVRSQGLRTIRYWGTAKTRLQSVATAAGMNVGRVFAWLDGVPRAKTRTQRFEQLAVQA